MMNKQTFKMNTTGILLIIILAIIAIMTLYYFYTPPAPVSDTINAPLEAPAPLNDNPADTSHPG